jgi:hypothetical protein
MKYEHTEEGVMIMKDGLAWGETYADGRETNYGWMDPTAKTVRFTHKSRAEFLQHPTDATWTGSHYTRELSTGKIVKVKRTVTVETEDGN